MTASTHATLHQTYSNAPIQGLPPRSDTSNTGDTQEPRLIMALSGRTVRFVWCGMDSRTHSGFEREVCPF